MESLLLAKQISQFKLNSELQLKIPSFGVTHYKLLTYPVALGESALFSVCLASVILLKQP